MFSRPRGPGKNPVPIALAMMALAFAIAMFCVATAHAAYYKTLYCGAADGSGNPVLGARPGFFDFTDDCGTAYGDPAGTGGFLRLEENTTGTAGNNDEASYSWWPPSGTSIAAVSAYTRVPGYFNSGWRERFWGEGYDGGEYNILMQGSGVPNEGIFAPATSNFVYHAWPFGSYGDYKRLVFAMTCYRPAGCSREGWNAADANSIAIILNDKEGPHINFEGESQVFAGDWVKGNNAIAWRESDQGSGLRFSRLKVDGATLSDGTIDYQANGGCQTGHSDANGEFARNFTPCTQGPYLRYYPLRTEWFSDGQHQLSTCVQDFAQYQHLGGSPSESCDTRTIHTDNTPPGAPPALGVTSSNPARYLDHFGAQFLLPQDAGSPIAKVHYYVTDDATGKVISEPRTISRINPTTISGIEGPTAPGAYTLHIALEDQVGFVGAYSTAPVPHDTTPPAAPQNLHVLGTTEHRVPKFDVSWQNVVDAGSPIDAAHYNLVDGTGNVVQAARTFNGEQIDTIHAIDSPAQAGDYKVHVWLSDSEGNVGVPATVAVPRDTTPPAAPQDVAITPPSTPRSTQGFDVQWRNITDDGSPIDAAHYRLLGDNGHVVVPPETISGNNPQSITNLDTPRSRGTFTLELWLTDAEGNTGAPIKAPLSFNCVRADGTNGADLTAGLGRNRHLKLKVPQGRGVPLRGTLTGPGGAEVGAPVCVFGRVVTQDTPQFLGVALTGATGTYRFGVPAGPSREITAVYRPDSRELTASTILAARVRPTVHLLRRPVHNKGYAVFKGRIPGPDNAGVVLVLQVKSGKGWRVFRRYRTRSGGRFVMRYRFTQTFRPTTYIMRVQVRWQRGYPRLPGASRRVEVPVRP